MAGYMISYYESNDLSMGHVKYDDKNSNEQINVRQSQMIDKNDCQNNRIKSDFAGFCLYEARFRGFLRPITLILI